MPLPISVDILSDDDIDGVGRGNDDILTPTPTVPKRRRRTTESLPNPTTVLIIDDDPTPRKPATESTPSVVPETPMSGFSNSDVAFVKCNRGLTDYQPSTSDDKFSGISRLICLESDSESANESGRKNCKENDKFTAFNVVKDSELSSRLIESVFPPEVTEHLPRNENLAQLSDDLPMHLMSSEDGILQVHDCHSEENGLDSIAAHEFPSEEIDGLEPKENVLKQKYRNKVNSNKEKDMDGGAGKKRLTKEERICLKEEKKQQREQEKLRKAALQAEAAELKKLQKIKQKWEKGKFALKSIIAEIDTKVVELGSVGGHLLTRFAEKGVTYRICSNPIERSIVWNMSVPEEISQLSSNGIVIPYVLFVFEAEEFCNLVTNESLMDHVSFVQSNYPSHTVCYVTNRLMAYIHKREHGQYKNPGNCSSWRRPPVEEVLTRLTTDFVRVHSRQCIDEAELAEHVVGLTCSLASCQFRKKLTQLSVYANGSLIPNDCIDKNLIKKNVWLKALVAIPKVQPRFAIAIWKKYPTMKSLLNVYLDPNKSVHEKEYLLQDLTVEGLLGEDRRLGEICSKRVYRILMAQCGSIKTDDVEDGADFFSHCVT